MDLQQKWYELFLEREHIVGEIETYADGYGVEPEELGRKLEEVDRKIAELNRQMSRSNNGSSASGSSEDAGQALFDGMTPEQLQAAADAKLASLKAEEDAAQAAADAKLASLKAEEDAAQAAADAKLASLRNGQMSRSNNGSSVGMSSSLKQQMSSVDSSLKAMEDYINASDTTSNNPENDISLSNLDEDDPYHRLFEVLKRGVFGDRDLGSLGDVDKIVLLLRFYSGDQRSSGTGGGLADNKSSGSSSKSSSAGETSNRYNTFSPQQKPIDVDYNKYTYQTSMPVAQTDALNSAMPDIVTTE